MKVLFTGMASAHGKRPTNTTFFTVLADVVSEFADVQWDYPKFGWTAKDLDSYDLVIFGLTAPTSLSANRIYGALSLLDTLFDSGKLVLVADGPQMWQYKNSIEAVKRDPSILFTNFYSKRYDFSTALSAKDKLTAAVNRLHSIKWPPVIYPELPWTSKERVARLLDFIPESSLIGINLDAFLINPEPARIGRSDSWAVENPRSSWLDTVTKVLSLPFNPTKVGKATDDAYALDLIRDSVGLLLPPQERKVGSWWNYRLYQALNTSTPVSTYWQDSHRLDQSWAVLAYQIEDMTPAQRQALASKQRESFIGAIPSRESALKNLINLLESVKESV